MNDVADIKKFLVMEVIIYTYYDPVVNFNFETKDYLKANFESKERYSELYGDGERWEYLILDREDLAKALRNLVIYKEITFPKNKLNDLARLLEDNNLGDEFYNNFITNLKFYQQLDRDTSYLLGKSSLDFYILDNSNITYWTRDPKEFKELLVEYLVDHHQHVNPEDFFMTEDEVSKQEQELILQEIRSELNKKRAKLKYLEGQITYLTEEIRRLEQELLEKEDN